MRPVARATGKTVVVWLIALAALCAGLQGPVLETAGNRQAGISLALPLVCAVLVFTWYYLDTNERAYRRAPLLNIMVVAAHYYLLRSRGAKPGFRAAGLFLLALLAWFVLAASGFEIGERVFS